MRGLPRAGGELDMNATRKQLADEFTASDGFTIAELLMAVAILFVVLMGVLGAVQFAAGATRQASVRQGAIELANRKIEFARDIPYQTLGTTTGDPTGVLLPSESITTSVAVYTVTTQVTWQRKSDPNLAAQTVLYKKIKVTVAWTSPNPSSVSIESAIYGRDTNSLTGDVLVTVADEDQYTQNNVVVPVGSASVMIDPAGAGANRTVLTGSDGTAFFGQIPYGAITTCTITQASYPLFDWYLFNTSQSTTVAPSVVNSWIAYVQTPKTLRVRVLGDSSAALASATVTLVNQDSNPAKVFTGPAAKTDVNGYATFTGLWTNRDAGGYKIKASYPNTMDNSETVVIQPLSTTTNAPDLTLHTPPPLTIVLKSAKTPNPFIQNATLTFDHGPQTLGFASTGTTGSVSFKPTVSGWYYFKLSNATGFAIPSNSTYRESSTGDLGFYVDLYAVNPPDQVVSLNPLFTLNVTVKDAYNGAVIPGLTVNALDSSNNVDGTDPTDNTGVASMGTIGDTGNYTAQIIDPAGLWQTYNSSAFSINVLTDTSPLNKTFSVYGGRVKVILHTNSGGSPTKSYTVTLYTDNTHRTSGYQVGSTVSADSTGTAMIGPVPTGTYYPYFYNSSTNSGYANSVTVTAGTATPFSVTYTGTKVQ